VEFVGFERMTVGTATLLAYPTPFGWITECGLAVAVCSVADAAVVEAATAIMTPIATAAVRRDETRLVASIIVDRISDSILSQRDGSTSVARGLTSSKPPLKWGVRVVVR